MPWLSMTNPSDTRWSLHEAAWAEGDTPTTAMPRQRHTQRTRSVSSGCVHASLQYQSRTTTAATRKHCVTDSTGSCSVLTAIPVSYDHRSSTKAQCHLWLCPSLQYPSRTTTTATRKHCVTDTQSRDTVPPQFSYRSYLCALKSPYAALYRPSEVSPKSTVSLF